MQLSALAIRAQKGSCCLSERNRARQPALAGSLEAAFLLGRAIPSQLLTLTEAAIGPRARDGLTLGVAVGAAAVRLTEDAQWILVHRIAYKLRWPEAPSGWSLMPILYQVKRLALLARSDAGLHEIFRRTEVATSKLVIPFVIGATDVHFPFPASTGIWRKVEFVNKYALGEQAQLIFGNGAKPIRN